MSHNLNPCLQLFEMQASWNQFACSKPCKELLLYFGLSYEGWFGKFGKIFVAVLLRDRAVMATYPLAFDYNTYNQDWLISRSDYLFIIIYLSLFIILSYCIKPLDVAYFPCPWTELKSMLGSQTSVINVK